MMQFVEEYDKELDHTFIIPELELEAGEEIDDFLVRQRPSIFRALAVAIELITVLDAKEVPTFVIRDTDMLFKLNREDADYSVDKCIEYFTEIEDYEKCARLFNLKSKL